MNNKTHQSVFQVTLLLIGSFLLMNVSTMANPHSLIHSGTVVQGDEPLNEAPAKKKKIKKLTSKKNNAVKIYMELEKKNIHVVAKRNNDYDVIDFFVFDLDGTLVQNYRMKAKDHKKITGLKNGTYIYRVFAGDEETSAGEIEIK